MTIEEIRMPEAEAASATAIQAAIDALGETGGRVVLPAMELALDRGLELRSGVELIGQGADTVLRKAPGRVYPLSGYHNYGMLDVPLTFTDGLEPGMTVAIRDDAHGGFFETFARITWVDGTWVGLDTGLHSDYHARQNPVLVTSFPLVYGLNVENAALRDVTLDGNRDAQPAGFGAEPPIGIGACRGAAVYFLRSHHFEVTGVTESGFAGEGLGFQMCSYVTIRDCHFTHNAGNGYHPGAGSTAARFENCTSEHNDAAGFYFCVRANHITVRDCTFASNRICGISVGTRDSFNLIEACRIAGNAGPGVLFRPTDRPVEMEAVRVAGCTIAGNATATGYGQIDVRGDARDVILAGNTITGLPDTARAGIHVAPSAQNVWLDGNQITDCFPDVIGIPASLAQTRPEFACGVEAAEARHFRHLGND